MTVDELRAVEFHEALRGYHPGQVDQLLGQVIAAIERRQPISPLLQNVELRRKTPGYRCEDVDELLDRLRLES